jgi:hypothetical protein
VLHCLRGPDDLLKMIYKIFTLYLICANTGMGTRIDGVCVCERERERECVCVRARVPVCVQMQAKAEPA